MKRVNHQKRYKEFMKRHSASKPEWALYDADGRLVRRGIASQYEAKQIAKARDMDDYVIHQLK